METIDVTLPIQHISSTYQSLIVNIFANISFKCKTITMQCIIKLLEHLNSSSDFVEWLGMSIV